MKKIFFWIITLSFWSLYAQSGEFDLNAYKQFLSTHQNLTTSQLLGLYPAGTFRGGLNITFSNAQYSQQVNQKYQLTPYEISLLNKNGFVVTERLSSPSFGHAFLDIYHKDLPVFISTDAILHPLHKSYDNVLTVVELEILIPKLESLLPVLHGEMSYLNNKYNSNPQMIQSLKDADIYLTIARKLIGQYANPFYSSNLAEIINLLNLINQGVPQDIALFSSTPKTIDFSQFKVRGHYTNPNEPKLAKYFQAMMWLGRIELYLIAPRSASLPPSVEDIKRQSIDAVLINEAILHSNSLETVNYIDGIIKFFVGESDNVTVNNLIDLTTAINLVSADQLTDNNFFKAFQDTLKNRSYAYQRILSQILFSDPFAPDSIVPASAYLLFGQRFIVDSYVASQVVYDRIKYNGQKIKRMLPQVLDILFALGNSATAQLLQSELNTYHYGTNLAGLRYLIDSYPQDFWDVSLYNQWLNIIRTLNPPDNRLKFPPFMQTAAWWQEKMNTQLTSWTQLRHDNLLYAKPSYSGGVICSYPYGYVEPFPDFYSAMKKYANTAFSKISGLTFPNDYKKQSILSYYSFLGSISDTLKSIAEKELAGLPLSTPERNFLGKVIYDTLLGCATTYKGWYPGLFYSALSGAEPFLESDFLTADIHTAPTDENGNMVGWVLHAGTGKINTGIFIAKDYNGNDCCFAGPVFSYHQYVSQNFLRINDEEWKSAYYNLSARPSFVNIYLADSTGNSKGEGPVLITSTGDIDVSHRPVTLNLNQNYPNPFNGNTYITFSIPEFMTGTDVILTIYDLNGKVIKSLVNGKLQADNYTVSWDGKDNYNKQVSSGIYFYELKAGGLKQTRKMTFLK